MPFWQWQYLGLLWMLGPFLPWQKVLDVNNFKIIESVFIDFHLTLPNRETERTEKERTWKDIWRVGWPETNIRALEVPWTPPPRPISLMTVTAPGLCRQWFWWDFSTSLYYFCTVPCTCFCDFQFQAAKLFLQAALAIVGTSLKTESDFQREEVQIEID